MTNIDANEIRWNLDHSYSRLPESFYSLVKPTPVRSPELSILNESLATELGLNSDALKQDNGIAIFAGNVVPKDAEPLAQAYAGHQFGHFTMLGDGRAILIGEQITPDGERVDIQLKGSGRTPYSRGGDGRAALGPMLREYIVSEAMHALRIPTTRSLAVVTTGETVVREMNLPGAILTRTASSHIRVGTFQYAVSLGNIKNLRALADYTIDRHFPHIKDDDHRYLGLLKEVLKRQAELITKWQLVGFIHGVMNTDNMAISGETIDYGPCAFMDAYDPETVFSSIDRQGRYAYGNQPHIAGWNLARFAETLIPLLHEDEEKALEIAQDAISQYPDMYRKLWHEGVRAKLGLFNEENEDKTLIEDLFLMMRENKSDFTNTFRALTMDKPETTNLCGHKPFDEWYNRWQARRERQELSLDESRELMRTYNPVVIPRNHRVEEALEAAVKQGDKSVMDKLLNVIKHPYDYSIDHDEYYTEPNPSSRPYRTYCGT